MVFLSVAVIYYTQIRSILLVLVLSMVVFTALLLLQGRAATAMSLVVGGAAMIVGPLFWVARRMGSVFDRFGTVATGDKNVIMQSRGIFVWDTISRGMWESPLGYGLGWWGMVHALFHLPGKMSTVWVEVMITAWVVDGGLPLLIGYFGAVLVATYSSLRIALGNGDRNVAYWAAVVTASNVGAVALCFSYQVFLSPIGLQFWLLNATLYGADLRARAAWSPPASPGPRRRVAARPWLTPPGPATT
jgi:hypothetical protein